MAEATLARYIPILITFILALVIVGVSLNIYKLIAPRRPSAGKVSTYESGEVPIGSGRGPVDVQYYLYVIVFLVIDIEAVFLIPWALRFLQLGVAGIVEMVIFVALVLVGWAYAWKKGALQWQS
ncbi:MAG TPA: NADH-quinone oxidoreductase subunit A [Candidatus Thermoplasmatota archaeon]|nr:NADH-quinone oxidoreductase subunit A [Candidatus Thermoplasmatota archaeon]